MKVALAQIRVKTGDIAGNERRILDAIRQAPEDADVVLFPEMCVSGYNCGEDFEYEDFVLDCLAAVKRIAAAVPEGKMVLIGGPRFADQKYDDSGNLRLHNSAFALRGGKVAGVYDKHILANDYHHEDRKYFVPGNNRLIMSHGEGNQRAAVFICEDVWHDEWVNHVLDRADVDHVLVLNFSYFSYDKLPVRHALAMRIAEKHDANVYYCNAVGIGDISKDILVYDGYSFAVVDDGNSLGVEQMPGYCQSIEVTGRISPLEDMAVLTKWTQIHQAAVHAVRWMYEESGLVYANVHISGGLDSALVGAIAVDAMGPERVIFETNPGEHTSEVTLNIAKRIAATHGVPLAVCPVGAVEAAALEGLKPLQKVLGVSRSPSTSGIVKATAASVGRTVMGLATTNFMADVSKSAGILATGNHTENILGWCNFHDIGSVGVMQPIGDLTKLEVVQLSAWYNQQRGVEIVPWELINGAMPAVVLDAIIEGPRGNPGDVVVPMAELGDAREDPFDYYVYSGVCASIIRDRRTPAMLMKAWDERTLSDDYWPAGLIYKYARSVFEAACYDSSIRSRRSVYKSAQHAPPLVLSKRARGFSSRETLINHYVRRQPAATPSPRAVPV